VAAEHNLSGCEKKQLRYGSEAAQVKLRQNTISKFTDQYKQADSTSESQSIMQKTHRYSLKNFGYQSPRKTETQQTFYDDESHSNDLVLAARSLRVPRYPGLSYDRRYGISPRRVPVQRQRPQGAR
jgi:hypothetical protein